MQPCEPLCTKSEAMDRCTPFRSVACSHQSYRAFFLYRTTMETFVFFLLAVFLSTALVRLMLYQSFFLKGR